MFKRPTQQKHADQRHLRGVILNLMNIAVATEVNEADPYTLPGDVLVEVIRRNATTGTNDAREIRQALRYLHEKGYVTVQWLPTGDFESVRITTDGIDYVQGGIDSDLGVVLHGR